MLKTISAGQYHYVSECSPPSCQRFLSCCCGWLGAISWQSIIAADCYIVASIVQALIGVLIPTYSPARWHCTLLTIPTVVMIALFNIFGASRMGVACGIFATCHVFVFVILVVSLWVLGPKTSARAVFFDFQQHGGGWPNVSWAMLVGQVSCTFVTIGRYSQVSPP